VSLFDPLKRPFSTSLPCERTEPRSKTRKVSRGPLLVFLSSMEPTQESDGIASLAIAVVVIVFLYQPVL
jgi:hypothetical protein